MHPLEMLTWQVKALYYRARTAAPLHFKVDPEGSFLPDNLNWNYFHTNYNLGTTSAGYILTAMTSIAGSMQSTGKRG